MQRKHIKLYFRGTPGPKVFPITADGGSNNGIPRYISNTLTRRYEGAQATGTYIGEGEQYAQGKPSGQSIQQEGDKPDNSDSRRGKTHTADKGRWNILDLKGLNEKDSLNKILNAVHKEMSKNVSPMRWVRTEKGKEYRRNSQKQGRDLTPFNDGYRELVEAKEPIIGTITNALQKDALLKQDMKIRRLTPIECERLQGFPEIEKSVIIELCLDQAKNSVNVGNKNHRLQKSVGNVEKTDLQENASVGKSLNTKLQPTSKPVQPDVVINCVENGVEILSQGKSLLNVHTATNNDTSALQMPIESFVRLIAGITQIVEQITQCGKEESQVKEPSLIVQENGTNYVKLYGIEKTQLAKDAKLDSTTLKELTKYIMLYPSGLKASDANLQTLFSYAIRAISGYIQELIPQKSSLVFRLNTKLGYTFGVSDTQRYKQLGNAVTVNVVEEIMKRF